MTAYDRTLPRAAVSYPSLETSQTVWVTIARRGIQLPSLAPEEREQTLLTLLTKLRGERMGSPKRAEKIFCGGRFFSLLLIGSEGLGCRSVLPAPVNSSHQAEPSGDLQEPTY
jgi:hypothetical protein